MTYCTRVHKRAFEHGGDAHLEDLLAAHLDAAVPGLGLLLGQLLSKDLQLLHKVPLVLGHGQALGLLGQLAGGQDLLGRRLLLQLVQTAGETGHPPR